MASMRSSPASTVHLADGRGPQKLQRRIANSRGIAPDASLVSPTQSTAEELKLQDAVKIEPPAVDSRETVGVVVTKRKYRRHPKVSLQLHQSQGRLAMI